MRTALINGVSHIVFDDIKEFENYFLYEYGVIPNLNHNWRTARELEWVLTDDGGVIQILRQGPMKHPGDRKNYSAHNGWCRTAVGTFMQNNKTLMDTDFSSHPDRYRFNSLNDIQANNVFKNRTELTKAERIFVACMISGNSPEKSINEAYKNVTNWRKKFLSLVKTERISNAIIKGVGEIAKKHGIDEDWILVQYKEIIESSKSPNARVSALRELAELIGMKNKLSIRDRELHKFVGFDDGLVNEIEAEVVETLSVENT